jgi:hypothetical protein
MTITLKEYPIEEVMESCEWCKVEEPHLHYFRVPNDPPPDCTFEEFCIQFKKDWYEIQEVYKKYEPMLKSKNTPPNDKFLQMAKLKWDDLHCKTKIIQLPMLSLKGCRYQKVIFDFEKENKMTKEEINQTITEAMGLCWHEEILPIRGLIKKCKHCGYKANVLAGSVLGFGEWNPDWTSREKFLDLWDWCYTQDWFIKMLGWLDGVNNPQILFPIDIRYISQPIFAEKVVEFMLQYERKLISDASKGEAWCER